MKERRRNEEAKREKNGGGIEGRRKKGKRRIGVWALSRSLVERVCEDGRWRWRVEKRMREREEVWMDEDLGCIRTYTCTRNKP